MEIKDLEPNSKVINLTGELNHLGETSSTPNGQKYQEGVISDNTGQVKITFWDDQVGKFMEGDTLSIKSGWCKQFEDELQISTGKYGKIEKIPKRYGK